MSEIKIHDDSGKPIRTAFVVTSHRVDHYSDFIEYLVKAEVARCKEQDKFTPTQSQIDFFRKEAVRYATIRRDMETAQKLRIKKDNKLFESQHENS
jgi:hypothetical protein